MTCRGERGLRPRAAHRCPSSEIRQRVGEVARDACGSPALAKRQPEQLSGGQQQRVALARALVNWARASLLLDGAARCAGPAGAAPDSLQDGAEERAARHGRHVSLREPRQERGAHHVETASGHEPWSWMEQWSVRRRSSIARARDFVAGFIGVSNLMPGEVVSPVRGDAARCAPSTQGPTVSPPTTDRGPAPGEGSPGRSAAPRR